MRMIHTVMMLAPALVAGRALAQAPDDELVRATIVYETGPTYVLQNDGEYGAGGTRYEADDVGQQDNLVRTWRNSVEVARGRHTFILLYAPLELRTQVELRRDLQFRDELFPTGTVVDHRYLFEGYRGSYLYRLVRRERLTLELGGTLQVRNIEVAFTAADGSRRDDEDQIGPAPAVKARLWWRPGARWPWAALEADALSNFGVGPDRTVAIYDVQLMLGAPVGRGVDLFLGARLYGHGTDIEDDAIYNWANFLSFTAGARVALGELIGSPRPR